MSQEGKERSAMRGFKGGERTLLRELARALKQQPLALGKNRVAPKSNYLSSAS